MFVFRISARCARRIKQLAEKLLGKKKEVFKMKKFIIQRLVAGTAAIAIVGAALVPTPAMANNHEDKEYSYSTGTAANVSGYASGARKKEDASSSYMYCKTCTVTTTGASGSGAYYGVVHGSKTKTGKYSNMATTNGRCSSTYTFKKGTVYFMSNYVNECGGTYAKIWCTPYGSGSGNLTFTGVWSPDSV
jgi:hypothetical protein